MTGAVAGTGRLSGGLESVRLQNIWHTWVLELVETFGFVPRLTAFVRANVADLSLFCASGVASLLPKYTLSGVTLASASC